MVFKSFHTPTSKEDQDRQEKVFKDEEDRWNYLKENNILYPYPGAKAHPNSYIKSNDCLPDNQSLIEYSKNDRYFDKFIGIRFFKGMTEIEYGTTVIIHDPDHHHKDYEDLFHFGYVKWICVGSILSNGFIGLDFTLKEDSETTATCFNDIISTCRTLVKLGFSKRKRLIVVSPPYLNFNKYFSRSLVIEDFI